MKRTTIFLDEVVERDLRILATRRKQPIAALVREALVRYLEQEKTSPGLKLGFLAAGRSGRSDIAERHEDLLWQERKSDRAEEKSASLPRNTAVAGRR